AASVLGYNGVLAEHRATGQKMVVVDSGKKPLLTPQDFEDGSADKKLEDLTKKLKYQFINIQDLKITKHGKINSFGQKTNFIKFQAKANKLPIGEIEGIISAVETEDGKIKIIASANEKGKYSQIVSEEFFKKVKE
ncbi:MAG TPA: hypothetical protein PLG15_05130, partial [Candidatus Gastranaerophilaceae bacterium]|nr:hypothetical protein [Candidatus Gastranaerophilaceae bacterium]